MIASDSELSALSSENCYYYNKFKPIFIGQTLNLLVSVG